RGIVIGEEPGLQLADPIPALGARQIRVTGKMALESKLIKLPIVKGAEVRVQPAKRPNQRELRGDDVNDETEPRLLGKCETILHFALHLVEWIARREKV